MSNDKNRIVERTINPMIYASVKMTTRNLSDTELAALNNAISAGFDPAGVAGFDKARHLFTEAGGTEMHADAQAAFEQIVVERLSDDAN